jgi:hypothetical protein
MKQTTLPPPTIRLVICTDEGWHSFLSLISNREIVFHAPLCESMSEVQKLQSGAEARRWGSRQRFRKCC